MANMGKTSYPLDTIRHLRSPGGWSAALRMYGLGKLLKGKRSADFEAGDLGDAEALKAKEE
ncbi:hypothetical protein E4U26_005683 [Claviceps purpurea]|nr:hypothetical protein E4U37_006691 [Claviceps purpurea]KAG6221865.1 hypothetical protein E4U26_005683 [Claviceps purpurea]